MKKRIFALLLACGLLLALALPAAAATAPPPEVRVAGVPTIPNGALFAAWQELYKEAARNASSLVGIYPNTAPVSLGTPVYVRTENAENILACVPALREGRVESVYLIGWTHVGASSFTVTRAPAELAQGFNDRIGDQQVYTIGKSSGGVYSFTPYTPQPDMETGFVTWNALAPARLVYGGPLWPPVANWAGSGLYWRVTIVLPSVYGWSLHDFDLKVEFPKF